MLIVAAAATAFRIVLAYNTPISPSTDATVDDALLMNYANQLLAGKWVGPYGVYTLAKNVGYSLCLVAFHLLGIRYQLGFVLLLILSCIVAAQSLRPLVPSVPVRCALYVLLLYMPAFFTAYFFQRIYRNGLAIVFALLVFSAFIGLYLRRQERLPKLVPWSLLAGLSLGFFSIIQESASWALPFVLVSTVVTVALAVVDGNRLRKVAIANRRRRRQPLPSHMRRAVTQAVAPRIAVLLLPLVLSGAFVCAMSAINYARYGVFVLNDKYQGEFARATADLMSIDVGYEDERVWVSRDALDKALKASPTLRSMKKEINKHWDVWENISTGFGVLDSNDEPQILGDHSYWALRDAYAAHGGYKSATKTSAFWGKVANELERAFDKGTLTKKDGLFVSRTTQPMPWDRVVEWTMSSVQVMGRYAWGDLIDVTLIRPLPKTDVGTGTLKKQLKARDLLGPNTLFKVNGKLHKDEVSKTAQPWLRASNAVGQTTLLVSRILLCAAGVGLVALLVRDVLTRSADGLRTGVILLALFLSALVLVFGASWMISFLSANDSAASAAGNAFSYVGAVYALLGYAECVVLGRLMTPQPKPRKREVRHVEWPAYARETEVAREASSMQGEARHSAHEKEPAHVASSARGEGEASPSSREKNVDRGTMPDQGEVPPTPRLKRPVPKVPVIRRGIPTVPPLKGSLPAVSSREGNEPAVPRVDPTDSPRTKEATRDGSPRQRRLPPPV
jgi:hypothetical protein